MERFHGKLRDELLHGAIFYTLLEAEALIERWRLDYNRVRPHSALGYRPPSTGDCCIPIRFAGGYWPGLCPFTFLLGRVEPPASKPLRKAPSGGVGPQSQEWRSD
ncbi:MAG: transposase [bacterium]|nr:transposase [bacterium]